jgi:hypothetical protein
MQIAGNEPAARDKLRYIIERSMMGPSAQALSEGERVLRSSLIAGQLMGLAFMRFIWKIEPLASMDDDHIVAAIAGCSISPSLSPTPLRASDRCLPSGQGRHGASSGHRFQGGS